MSLSSPYGRLFKIPFLCFGELSRKQLFSFGVFFRENFAEPIFTCGSTCVFSTFEGPNCIFWALHKCCSELLQPSFQLLREPMQHALNSKTETVRPEREVESKATQTLKSENESEKPKRKLGRSLTWTARLASQRAKAAQA